ncbi:MAG: Ribonuclease BN [uncultured Acidimicrobiales bacterium]|uniref:Ribonuclease BN n=1 Tax=uncultured Acidimicrobiales bacterium TaxID=310071 RepID=A0A6J4I6X7_9ACTN|nr:MAG: Ribonuclease BN [uncultured Acidimicrobiales bacterium]
MRVDQRLDGYQRRHRWLGVPIAVIYKFFDDQGVYLGVLVTHYAFLSIFPLLLISSSVLGFVLRGNPELQDRILASALRQFPVIGQQLGRPEGLRGSTAAIVVGTIGTIYGALGVSLAVQNAMNIAWAVPRNQRPNPIQIRLRGARLLATVGVAFAATTVLSALSNRVGSFGWGLGVLAKVAVVLLAMTLNAGTFSLVMRMATTRDVTLREAAPGAIAAAVVWQLLQVGGAAYIRVVIDDANTTNGIFALVLGLIAWLYLGSASFILCAEINVVLAEHLYPRALLTPFSERVNLTGGDRAAYASYAGAQQHKAYEKVETTFDNDGQYGPSSAPPASPPDVPPPTAAGQPAETRPPVEPVDN